MNTAANTMQPNDRVALAHYIDTHRGRLPEGKLGVVVSSRGNLVVVYFDDEASIRGGSNDHGGWYLEPRQLRLDNGEP